VEKKGSCVYSDQLPAASKPYIASHFSLLCDKKKQ